jgi:TerC family integral membrane protein
MQTVAPLWLWGFFVAVVLIALFIDFVVLKKQGAHEVGVKEALNWSLVWVAVSLAFNAMFWWAVKDTTGDASVANTKALEFLTGYLIEKSLAVDNIFVFLMIFTYFAVPAEFQKRVLMIGIIGAIVLRTVMILAGSWLISEFHWVLYVFGAFLVLTGIKMWWASGKENDLESNPALKLLRRLMPVSKNFDGERFFTVENGKRIATPLLLVIALVGLTDADSALLGRGGQFGPDVRVRHLVGLDPGRQAVAVAAQMEPGMRLAFCQRNTEAARRDLVRICSEIREELETEAAEAAAAAAPAIRGAVYISCNGRGGPHFGDVRRQPARRGKGGELRMCRGQALRLQLLQQHAREGIAELLQGLGGQLFDKQFNKQIGCVHGVLIAVSAYWIRAGGQLMR